MKRTNFKWNLYFLTSFILFTHFAFAAEIEVFSGLSEDQKMIVVRGPIEDGDDEIFFDLAESIPRASVFLESPGGLVKTGISIGAEIAIRNYSTLVLDGAGCHSICAVIWVSGIRRYMSPNAKISVHAAYRSVNDGEGNAKSSESGVANAQIGAFLNELGLSAKAIKYFTNAHPDQPLQPITPSIAQFLDIDVFIQNGADVTKPADRQTPRRITRQVSEYAALAGHCTQIFEVGAGYWHGQAKRILKRGHALFDGEIFSALLGEYISTTKMEIAKNGFVRWCIRAESNLRADQLPTGIVGPSYDCSKSSSSTEFTICASRDLWAMDRAMASLYFFFRKNIGTQESQRFLASQRAWLKRRDECGPNMECLKERYSSRLFDFGI